MNGLKCIEPERLRRALRRVEVNPDSLTDLQGWLQRQDDLSYFSLGVLANTLQDLPKNRVQKGSTIAHEMARALGVTQEYLTGEEPETVEMEAVVTATPELQQQFQEEREAAEGSWPAEPEPSAETGTFYHYTHPYRADHPILSLDAEGEVTGVDRLLVARILAFAAGQFPTLVESNLELQRRLDQVLHRGETTRAEVVQDVRGRVLAALDQVAQ